MNFYKKKNKLIYINQYQENLIFVNHYLIISIMNKLIFILLY